MVAYKIAEHEPNYAVDKLWKLLVDSLRDGIQTFIPHKTLKTKASCLKKSVKNLVKKIRRRDEAYTRSRNSGRLEDETKFQTLKMEVQKELRRAYWNYV